MPLDDTNQPKRKHVRTKPLLDSKPNANALARAELPATLAALCMRAKTSTSRKWVTYAVATQSQSLSEAWRDASKKALVACGALPDYAANPLVVGTHATIYTDPLVTVGVKVVPQAPRLDIDACFADLLDAGVKPALLKRLRKKHTTEFNGAHIITTLLTSP
jgi:hypothetical protein